MQTNEEPSALPPEEPQNRIRSVGETLRSAREAARVSLEQAGEELRIEPKFLAALEEERYEAIGIPVFAKGYLKLYCEYLGLDYPLLLPLYEEKAGRQAPPLRGRHSIERQESSGSGIWLILGLGVVVLILFLVWLLRDSLPGGVGSAIETIAPSSPAAGPAVPSASPLTTAAARTPAAAALETRAASSSEATAAAAPESTAAASREQTAAASREARTAALPEPTAASAVPTAAAASDGRSAPSLADASSAAAGVTASSAVGGTASAARGTASAARGTASAAGRAASAAGIAAPVTGPQLDVDMKFVQDSWVEVEDSSNARLYYGLGKAGEESHLVGVPPFTVLIGNADGVVLEVGGRPYAYPRRARGNVASFTLTAPSE